MTPKLLDAHELADKIGSSYARVLEWHRLGVIPSIKTSHGVFFNLDLVVKAMRARAVREEEVASC